MKPLPFIGRQKELTWLTRVRRNPGAHLVVIRGRRRIGKSRLLEEFAQHQRFIKFSGLYPHKGIDAAAQRANFVVQLQQQLAAPKLASDDWSDLFYYLAQQTQHEAVIILFDEISWMAEGDDTFLPKLKIAWDDHFKQNDRLMLVLCGSISSWIEKNILASTGFLGRISEKLTLSELSLAEMCQLFHERGVRGSSLELLHAFAITGGVPWYLELFSPAVSIMANIKRLCFHADGMLVEEFQRIFHDLFKKRAPIYRDIVLSIVDNKRTQADIAKALHYSNSAQLSDYLHDLETAGFLAKDEAWSFASIKTKKQAHFRLKDNYLRFYFRCIAPRLSKILKRDYEEDSADIPSFASIMGLQFENLVLNNRQWIIQRLGLTRNQIVFDNPYFQRATQKVAGCQIDYLIQTNTNTLYVCEIKFSKQPISVEVIPELAEKIRALALPKTFSCVPVLIYASGVSQALEASGYFCHLINMTDFLEGMHE